MRKNFTVKNVIINALQNIYGYNTVQPKSIIGNHRQRTITHTENLIVIFAAKHISKGLGCGDTRRNVLKNMRTIIVMK